MSVVRGVLVVALAALLGCRATTAFSTEDAIRARGDVGGRAAPEAGHESVDVSPPPLGSAGQGGMIAQVAGGAASAVPASVAGASAGGMRGDAGRIAQAGSGVQAPSTPPSSPSTQITVWLAGDSTVAKGNTPCPVGWGVAFGELFDARVTVNNRAVGGRSVRTWLYDVQMTMDSSGECELARDDKGEPILQARWSEMLDGMKPGDYLLIQFGINDSAASCDRHVGVTAFKESYRMMAEAAMARGAQPLFITPVSSIACDGRAARASRAPYDQATKDAGAAARVPVLDLEAASVALYNQRGFCPVPGGGDVTASTTGDVGAFFCDDHTHFSQTGAGEIARLVAAELRKQGIGLADRLK